MYLCGIPYCELGGQKKHETKRHRNRSLKLIYTQYERPIYQSYPKRSPQNWIWDGIHPIADHEMMVLEGVRDVGRGLF
jgi:hypothetical protein